MEGCTGQRLACALCARPGGHADNRYRRDGGRLHFQFARKAGRMRKLAWLLLGVIGMAALLAPWIAPYGYAEQFRDAGGRWFAMGVDDLGRDRLSRLLYGTRISLGLAPAAALVSIA